MAERKSAMRLERTRTEGFFNSGTYHFWIFSILLLFVVILPVQIFSITADLSANYNFGDNLFSIYNEDISYSSFLLSAELSYKAEGFEFLASLNAANDRLYNDSFSDSYYGGFYFSMGSSGISVDLGNANVTFGKMHLSDEVESPYSLFISSMDLPRNTINFSFEDDNFLYTTRWIELTNLLDSSTTTDLRKKYRGMNYKVYATKFGNFRFGYQEADIYVGKTFDLEYFANPIPGFFIQYVNDNGRPYPEGLGEANYVAGFFLDYSDNGKYAYAQILIDDINANRFLHPESYQNPDKIAWSLGGRVNTPFGILAFYNAGATKYTFQPSAEGGNQQFYGYTYYSDFLYKQTDGNDMILPLELLYTGYKYGENNVAFRLEYESTAPKGLFATVEYVVLGERSPINAWNGDTTYISGTHLLDDSVLEHRLIGNLTYTLTLPLNLSFNISTDIGYIWNKSVLTQADDYVKKPFLKPQLGNDVPYFSLTTGLNFSFSF